MNTLLIGAVAALAVAVAILVVAVLRRRSDPALPLFQQQIVDLRTEVSATLNQQATLLQKQMDAVNVSLRSSSGDINQRLDNAARLYAGLQTQLGQLTQANQQIQTLMKDMSSLQDILRPPKLRGGMGEVLLENLLREILPPEHFGIQHRFAGGQIVDAVIRFRDGVISVDAKFPLENFRRMLEATDDTARQTARKEFARNIRKHIDDIHEKYIRADEGTLPFAFMYIPAENVYYEAIIRGDEEGEKALYAYATTQRVIPVSPNSFYAYLITLAQGFRGMKIEERAQEIVAHLNRLQLELGKFTDDFRKVGVHLVNAQTKFADAEKRLTRFEEKLLSAGDTPDPDLLPLKTES